MLRRLTTTLVLLAAITPARAQPLPSFPTADPTMMRIWRLGMDSSRAHTLAQVLFDSVGPRLTASPGFTRAADWVIDTYRSWGVDARKEPYGTWRGWRRGTSHIDLVSPRVRSLEGTMLAWSPGTKGKAVRAEAVALPLFRDSLEFVRWLPTVKGKIVLVSPPWPTCRPSEDWIRWATPQSKARIDTAVAIMQREWAVIVGPDGKPDSTKLYRGTGYSVALGTGSLGVRLEHAGAVGVVSSRTKLGGFTNPFGPPPSPPGTGPRPTPGPASARGGGPPANVAAANDPFRSTNGTGGWGVTEIFETYNTIAPAVTLSCEDYGLVFRLAENRQKPVLALELDSELLGEQPAFNVIAEIKGAGRSNEYVMLSAHFDSWDGGSGATDNGTGTLMALEAIRILKAAYPKPKRTILVGHWNSEEQGLNGSRAFTEDHPEVMKGLQALFNQDNGTGRVQNLNGAGLSAMGAHLKAWYQQLPSFYTDSLSPNVVAWSFNDVPTGNPGGTDGAVFACYGTPAFGMGALPWNYFSYTWHTGRDTYDKVVFDDLKHNATLMAMLAYLASEDPEFIARERSPGTWPPDWPANCGKAPRKTRPRL